MRYITLAVNAPYSQMYFQSRSMNRLVLEGCIVFSSLVLFKVLLGVGLYFYAHYRNKQTFTNSDTSSSPVGSHVNLASLMGDASVTTNINRIVSPSSPTLERQGSVDKEVDAKMKERMDFMEELSGIERYKVYKGRVV